MFVPVRKTRRRRGKSLPSSSILTFASVKSFKDLCILGELWANNERKESLGNKNVRQHINLYEMTEGRDWIRPIVAFLNRKGWFSTMTQPAREFPTRVFRNMALWEEDNARNANSKSPYNFNPPFNAKTMIKGNFTTIQRAFYSGFMSKVMANRLQRALARDPFLLMVRSDKPQRQTQLLNKSCNRFITVIAKDGVPLCKETLLSEQDSSLPFLHGTYFTAQGSLADVKDELPNFRDRFNNYVNVSVMDKRWNDNSYMWNKLVQLFDI